MSEIICKDINILNTKDEYKKALCHTICLGSLKCIQSKEKNMVLNQGFCEILGVNDKGRKFILYERNLNGNECYNPKFSGAKSWFRNFIFAKGVLTPNGQAFYNMLFEDEAKLDERLKLLFQEYRKLVMRGYAKPFQYDRYNSLISVTKGQDLPVITNESKLFTHLLIAMRNQLK